MLTNTSCRVNFFFFLLNKKTKTIRFSGYGLCEFVFSKFNRTTYPDPSSGDLQHCRHLAERRRQTGSVWGKKKNSPPDERRVDAGNSDEKITREGVGPPARKTDGQIPSGPPLLTAANRSARPYEPERRRYSHRSQRPHAGFPYYS